MYDRNPDMLYTRKPCRIMNKGNKTKRHEDRRGQKPKKEAAIAHWQKGEGGGDIDAT